MSDVTYILPIAIPSSIPKNSIKLTVFIALWYIFASLAVCTSKKITMMFPLPLHLCLAQLIIAVVTCSLTAIGMGNLNSTEMFRVPSFEGVAAGVLFSLGFVFTNLAITCSTVSFAETVKASESVTTIVLGYIFYNEKASIKTYLTIIPVCAGVILSCYSADQFMLNCFTFAALSNFCFSGRAVILKKSKRQVKSNSTNSANHNLVADELLRFTEMCLVGTVLVFVMCLISGAQSMEAVAVAYSQDGTWNVMKLVLLNGCAFSGYNVLSMIVLSQTELFTHTILNAIRRVCMIIVSVLYFRNHISFLNVLGIVLAAGGALLYSYVKSFGGPVKKG